ncbi:protein UPSTREAM OF FLC [Amborella trichopoda]|uniref:SOSEKI DIX-like domain-containing protein n=1 Tax=Amborella trichopoda TaxID=13333 RepID=W1NGA2_AMBTC|nr:protein UPSTREAM OF FLC [Amborella trichopoda]ERM94214.1 hypothetical protein AMTR_s00010p00200600 [Amborella trichopoda]|eukprot:XP_006826977.1 protein UPSTREAM OF FLC [Amborella trichopoda]
MDVQGRKNREASPDRAKIYMQSKTKQNRRVQILYYLSRNGQLEHPHFMEVGHPATQQLRLKDVMDRLTVLRGKGMPSLFSWSCKRNYKNGYVWNDLSENDIIYPTEGAEYVLKGSELIDGCSESIQQLQLSSRQINIETRGRKQFSENLTPRISRGASPEVQHKHIQEEREEREEREEVLKHQNNGCSTELSLTDTSSPPSSSSTLSEKAETLENQSKKKPMIKTSRHSAILQLLACGSMAMKTHEMKKGRNLFPPIKNQSLHKRVVCKTAAKNAVLDEDLDYLPENLRFRAPHPEEREYFSGSIVERAQENQDSGELPSLKKSSSYNEERASKSGMAEALGKSEKGRCMPRKRSVQR